MKRKNLPTWLYGMQALVWLVIRDLELTARALPSPEVKGIPFPPLRRNEAASSSLEKKLASEQSPDHAPPAASKEERSAFFHDPFAWGGITDDWWCLYRGDTKEIAPAIATLVRAASAGQVATREAAGRRPVIEAALWVGKTLIEDPEDRCALIMVPTDRKLQVNSKPPRPLFARDDVFKLALESDKSVNLSRSREDIDRWMLSFAEEFVSKNKRPPLREKEAEYAATKAGFTRRAAREAYAKLPVHLKNAPSKPRTRFPV